MVSLGGDLSVLASGLVAVYFLPYSETPQCGHPMQEKIPGSVGLPLNSILQEM